MGGEGPKHLKGEMCSSIPPWKENANLGHLAYACIKNIYSTGTLMHISRTGKCTFLTAGFLHPEY